MKLNHTPEEYSAKAKSLFEQGYNCAQAVFLAFEDITGLDTEFAAKVSSSFGGGMGRLREVCGAVSGMFAVAGIARGYSDPKAKQEKADHYAFIQSLAAEYKKDNGSIICKELLDLPGAQAPVPEERTADYYRRRPCGEYVASAAKLLAEKLAELD
ncbi:MAG: C_GCAxxG_C_C family protein [Clostridia bacterium]|nr:C_GCAxxG_C_C family protein [Clostridia bacterium]